MVRDCSRPASDHLAVLFEAETPASRSAQYLSLDAHDRGLARQFDLAKAASELVAVAAVARLAACHHRVPSSWMARHEVDR